MGNKITRKFVLKNQSTIIHLEELYGAEVSESLISRVTDDVIDEVKAWQSRALE
jgi:transposase-like protein